MPQTGSALTAAGLTGARVTPAGLTPLVKGIAGIYLPGIAGNYASAPDSAVFPTGDITIDAKGALTLWSSGSQDFFSKSWVAGGNLSCQFGISGGSLLLQWSGNGSSTISGVSTVGHGIANGATRWIRACLQVNDGSGHNVLTFYTAPDGTSWSQVGAAVTNTGTTSIFDGSAGYEIGSAITGTSNLMTGTVNVIRVYAANLLTAAGTPVFAVDFSTKQPGAKTLLDSAGGALVTINGTLWRDSLI